MANLVKYMLTVDADTGVPVRLQKIGEAGDVTDVDLSMLAPPVVASAPAPAVVIHVYSGTAPQPATAIGPGGSIVHQPGLASIVHQPGAASIVHAPAASIVHQPGAASIVHAPAASIVHQPASSIVHAEAPATEKKDDGKK